MFYFFLETTSLWTYSAKLTVFYRSLKKNNLLLGFFLLLRSASFDKDCCSYLFKYIFSYIIVFHSLSHTSTFANIMDLRYIFLVVISGVCFLNGITQARSIQVQPTVRLMNAVHGEVLMPVVGLGTGGYGHANDTSVEYWGPELGHNASLAWLKAGGRRIDTSVYYKSIDGVGTGWIASGVPRSEIFITSKVEPYGYDQALDQFAALLKSLQTDYVDLLLIHWPGDFGSESTDIPCKQNRTTWAECRIQTWQALETIFKQGHVRFSP